MNLNEINKAIEQLENGETTYTSCEKLASLYIVREHLTHKDDIVTDTVVNEYTDILPSYTIYKNTRTRYALGEVSVGAVEESLALLCIEIKEFLHTLYCTTDNSDQRKCIMSVIEDCI